MALDKAEFAAIRRELNSFEEKRERLIQQSRAIIKLSKQIIYSVHRDDMPGAAKLIKSIKSKVKQLPEADYETGMKRVALQEYAEALTFYEFIKTGKIPAKKTLGISTVNYLLGLCDLTGELVRKAVKAVIKKKYDEAVRIRDVVDDIYGEFLKFNLRNSELRKKSDSIKWNLKKLEDVVYDIRDK